ncbi:hypothetical protein [Halomonas sp. ML-15]|uniref:hypothetical protein n=1 Tax=Halomonas sp. ML-15 TaxID=2773305 RepID=UPI001CD114BC|nr:hypothetical protein [Halomonas sp. ML-15]
MIEPLVSATTRLTYCFPLAHIHNAVADAPEFIKNGAFGVLNHQGGSGALRELADAILEALGKSNIFSAGSGF